MSTALGVLGGGLLLAGLIVPGKLDPVYRAWMGFAHALSRVTTPILMSIVYFLVITPIALFMRGFGYDPLRQRVERGGRWRTRDAGSRRSDLGRQF